MSLQYLLVPETKEVLERGREQGEGEKGKEKVGGNLTERIPNGQGGTISATKLSSV